MTAPGLRLEVSELAMDGLLLFRNLDLTLPAGRWTCLLGPSGSGKTSILRLIAGLLEGGSVAADDGAPLKGRIAYMAQSDMLLPWLTLRQNLVLGWRLRGSVPASRLEAAEALLERVGLAGRGDALPQALSGGMRQRAALARTLVEDRPVVLMDEPFSALDAITRHRLQDLAAELLQDRTVLLVTHSPLEALRLGHEVRVLRGDPALPGPAFQLVGLPPRDAADPSLATLQGRLLDELAAAV